jgi:hypothetical protein
MGRLVDRLKMFWSGVGNEELEQGMGRTKDTFSDLACAFRHPEHWRAIDLRSASSLELEGKRKARTHSCGVPCCR